MNKPRTNIYVMDQELWEWAKYRARVLGYSSVAEYVFKLLELDREENIAEYPGGP